MFHIAGSRPKPSGTQNKDVPDKKPLKPNNGAGCTAVPDKKGDLAGLFIVPVVSTWAGLCGQQCGQPKPA